MKKSWPLFAALLLACLPLFSQGFQPGKLLVKIKSEDPREFPQFKEGTEMPDFANFPDVEALLQRFPLQALYKPFKTQNIHVQHIYELHFDRSLPVEDMIEAWQAISYIEYAEQMPLYELHYVPNDFNAFVWGLPKVQAEEAWDLCRGSRSVTIGLVDDAVRLSHEDLAPQIFVNTGEIPGDSIDNDGNGWIDDVSGYDIADSDNDPNPPSQANNNTFSHGTHTAGIAAASSDNNKGIASLGFNVSLVPIKAKEDTTYTDNFLQATFTGIDYAIANGYDIVSMSFGSNQYNFSMYYLIQAGYDSGMVFIASAGNTGTYSVFYPSAYDNVISVGSTDFNDSKSGFSTYHWSVDVMAPGGGIYSSVAGGDSNYGFKSGTSMSAPMVSSLAALMLSADSTLSPGDLEACLKASADNIDSQNSNYVGNIGAGRINAYEALLCIGIPASASPSLGGQLELNRVFPNPAMDRALVSAQILQAGKLKLRLLDLGGREIRSVVETDWAGGKFEHFVERNGLAGGIYLLEWNFEGQLLHQRICFQ